MTKTDDKLFDENMHILNPGDFYATENESIIGTVTGSSVLVCLYDDEKGIGGMGHIVVPGEIDDNIISDEVARVGIANMEYLMAEIVKLGGDRKFLKAKIFGSVESEELDKNEAKMLKGNLQFIKEYFELEKILIKMEDMGGTIRKKIIFHPTTGMICEEAVSDDKVINEFLKLEKKYIENVFNNLNKSGNSIIFD